MSDKDITSVEFESLEQFISHINYNDGDMAFIDDLESIPDFEAVRIGVHVALLCESGQMQLDVNGHTQVICEDEILICPTSGIIDNVMVSSDFKCKILCMTNNILGSLSFGNSQLLHQAVYVEKINIIPLDKKAKERFLNYYALGKQVAYDDVTHPFHKEMMQSLVQSFLFFIFGHFQKFLSSVEPTPYNYGEKLFERFLGLLSKEPIKRHSVDYYADKLCVTPKYLTIICNRISQKTASEWIRDFTIDEIRYYLRNTDKSIKEISSSLDFPSVQAFGKYVYHNLGFYPKEYRNRSKH